MTAHVVIGIILLVVVFLPIIYVFIPAHKEKDYTLDDDKNYMNLEFEEIV